MASNKSFDELIAELGELSRSIKGKKKMIRVENLLKKEKKKKVYINELNNGLTEINNRNKKVLCDSCKKKKIGKLTEKCENVEIAELIYECELAKLNAISRD